MAAQRDFWDAARCGATEDWFYQKAQSRRPGAGNKVGFGGGAAGEFRDPGRLFPVQPSATLSYLLKCFLCQFWFSVSPRKLQGPGGLHLILPLHGEQDSRKKRRGVGRTSIRGQVLQTQVLGLAEGGNGEREREREGTRKGGRERERESNLG